MFAYTRAALVAALFYQATVVLTNPVDLAARSAVDADWVQSNFVKCMKGVYPNFPQGSLTADNAARCHTQSHKPHKRSATGVPSDSEVEGYGLEARNDVALSVTNDPACNSDHLPKNFMVVTDIRAKAKDYCNEMKADLIQNSIGSISPTLANAVTKSANELHGGKAVMLSLVLGANPPALAALKTVQGIDTKIVDVCTKALIALATKGQGCTGEINSYNAAKAKQMTTTGAIGGAIDISNGQVPWFWLAADYLAPN